VHGTFASEAMLVVPVGRMAVRLGACPEPRAHRSLQVYKQPNPDNATLDRLANVFLIDTEVKDLPPEGQDQARNMTKAIYIVQQEDQNVTMRLEPAPSAGSSGEAGGGGGTTPEGGSQMITLPVPTTDQGDFDIFVPIQLNGLLPGDQTRDVQRLNVYANGSELGNATAYLVPPTGLTFISDIDDILRVTKIYKPSEGLLNSFGRPFVPWMDMPSYYSNWSQTLHTQNVHFHWLTTTPEQVTRNYSKLGAERTGRLGRAVTQAANLSPSGFHLQALSRRFLRHTTTQLYVSPSVRSDCGGFRVEAHGAL
jgi:hypothetical protein